MLCERAADQMSRILSDRRVVSCASAGVILAVIGYLFPLSMFSGESDMHMLMVNWTEYSAGILVLTSAAKLFLVNICIRLGWRGGSIFPVLFAGTTLGYAFALVSGMDGTFAVAVTAAALYGFIQRKPLTVTAVLLLCFPLSYVVPVGVTAFLVSRIPFLKPGEV